MIKYFNGIPVVVPNTITKSSAEEKYYVSYNPSKRDFGVDTTALVVTIGDNERIVFYTLKGKHSEQYASCSNLKDCINYYMSNKDSIHGYSDAFEHGYLLQEVV